MNQPVEKERKFFGHPWQLSSLFQIELWERFSFYGMQGILLIYLYYQTTEGGLGIDKAAAGGIVGTYGGSVYLSTILGGWLADRLWGAERTLFYAGMMVMAGHIVLALIPGVAGLFCGLVLIALGSGGVKAAAGSMVGSLYESEELRPLRDAGFSIFYISINIGGFLGPLLTGLLQSNLGFHYGFGAAAVGMALGLLQYAYGRKALPPTPAPFPLPAGKGKAAAAAAAGVVAVLLAAVWSGWLNLDNFSTLLLAAVILAALVYFVRLLGGSGVEAQNKRHITAYIPLFAAICIFWALWFQVFTAVTVYFDETADRSIGSFTIPVAWKDSLQSLWVILFSGLMAAMWTKMGRKQPKTPLKFALSVIVLGVSYWCFVPFITSGTVMPLAVFALVILGITIAELLISPISLSLTTKIAPPHFKTQMVALTFLAFSLGFTLGGRLFKEYFTAENAAAFYRLIGTVGLAAGMVLLVLVPVLNRLLEGVD
ncbi:oligopeptide:H+ symporter [Neisseria musculi]|uniref:H+ symporter family protein n=1 Tax=Neisseria musculi TaxID=1815583 RepID=A0A7H1M7U6_9NEIS|nr:oligopeptide:H+ symporter [Neisseria musculi]QNT57711.1 H+ symporter family protein [Neisseria musculi]